MIFNKGIFIKGANCLFEYFTKAQKGPETCVNQISGPITAEICILFTKMVL